MQERKREDSILKDYKKLGLQDLVKKIFPEMGNSGSKAMQIVTGLKLIFTKPESPLQPLLSAMPAKTYPEQLQLWDVAKEKYERKKAKASRKALKEITNK